MEHQDILSRLAETDDARIVLLVIDGLGDLRTTEQPQTALEAAETPNLDELAAKGSLGRLVPVDPGITPGSGPGHLGLFGYDTRRERADIGRGVLEALGLDLDLEPGDVVARGNFATADGDGKLTDRRAGRLETEETRRVIEKLRGHLEENPVEGLEGVEVRLEPGEGYRFVLVLSGEGLSPEIADTDPQETGVPPLTPEATSEAAAETVGKVRRLVDRLHEGIADEEKANRMLLRGFSSLPDLPPMNDLYGLTCGCIAGYPLYRGVSRACGMEVVPCGKEVVDVFETAEECWDRFDFLFLHVKPADSAGEDGDLEKKRKVIEEVDRHLPRLLELGPEVLAVTGDHSTPVPMKSHSWHPVPLLVSSPRAFMDECDAFSETQATRAGYLGTLPSRYLVGLLLAHAGKLAKFGA